MNIERAFTSKNYPTLNDILKHRSDQQPNLTAYRFLLNEKSEEMLSYEELFQRTCQLGAYIKEHTKPLDRILLAAQPGFDFIIGFFACLMTRTIAVPIFPPANAVMANRFLHVFNNAKPSLILCDGKTSQTLSTAQKANLLLPGKMKQFFGINEAQSQVLTAIRKARVPVFNIDDSKKYSFTEQQFPQCGADDVAFLQYTSGSTSNPRGVMLTHGNLLANLKIIHHGCQYDSQSHLFSWLPPYHDMGLIAGIISPLYEGMLVTLMSTLDFIISPSLWVIEMSRFQCTRTGGPNFAYELCAHKTSEQLAASLDLSRLEAAANGAEPLNTQTIELFYNKFKAAGLRRGALLPCYGLAESTLMCAGKTFMTQETVVHVNPEQLKNNRIELVRPESQSKQLISSGLPLMDIKIVNPNTLIEVEEFEVGEIWVHGTSIAKGYYNNPEETEKTFNGVLKNDVDEKKYLRTGDLGFIHDGELFVCGRLKHLIIVHGQNYYPHDIEQVVVACDPHIRVGCAAAYAATADHEEALAVVAEVQKNTKEEDFPAIIENIQKAVTNYFQLSVYQIFLIPNRGIPKTTSGKLERLKCKELIENNSIKPLYSYQREETIAPQQPQKSSTKDWLTQLQDAPAHAREALLKSLITSLTGEVLSPQNPSLPDPDKGFFELGLDSIKAIELKTVIEEALLERITLDNTIVFNYPNINALTQYLLIELGFKEQEISSSAPRAKIEEEDIAIIGMSGQFPGANNLEEFWQLLSEQREGIREIPPQRWDVDAYYDLDKKKPGKICTRRAGFVEDIQSFDPSFFSITPKAAEYLDPQQRMLLQQTWHALENAALIPKSLHGSETGVFVGISSHDYETLIIKNLSEEAINRQIATGNAASAAAGRLSYFLGLEGPCFSIDTACSSSLVAIHEACQHLLRNECGLAIAGGVNALLSPYLFINFSKAGMLSTDGRCKTFDASADGYVRGEGCGVVILKRLSAALRDKNQIVAVIKSSGINQDGASSGLTVPNGNAQKKLLTSVLEKSKLDANQIDYIECHGTGTILGDTIEANTIGSIYTQKRQKPLILGSVKTNIGHLEAAAGIAGFIKTLLAMQKELIPANLNYSQLNSSIKLGEYVDIASTTSKWQNTPDKVRYAGVSAFGFTGTNAHVIVAEAPSTPKRDRSIVLPEQQLFILSAKTRLSLEQNCAAYIRYLQDSSADLADICYTLATGRQHFNYRIALIVSNKQDLLQQLKSKAFDVYDVKTTEQTVVANSLTDLLQAYQNGAHINWAHYYEPFKNALRTVSLPNYCFQKESYWFAK